MHQLIRTIVWSFVALCIVLLASFAIANRQVVSINLWPLPFATALPLYAAILGAFAVGLLFGSGIIALSRQRLKIQARMLERRAERAERTVAEQKAAMSEQPHRPLSLTSSG